jgi:hypothetical protein
MKKNEARHRMRRIIDDALQFEGQHLKVLHINSTRSINEAHHRCASLVLHE